MRERISASCLALTALVSSEAKCASGMVAGSRCGLTYSAARGTATWVWMSMVVDAGRVSRPGLPCLRAAVLAYLFQIPVMTPSLLVGPRPQGRGHDRDLEQIRQHGCAQA